MGQEYTDGEVYTETIDRISNNGNGLINMEHGHINLGKMRESRAGEEVTFKYLGNRRVEVLGFPSQTGNPLRRDEKENKNDLLNDNQ